MTPPPFNPFNAGPTATDSMPTLGSDGTQMQKDPATATQ